MMYVRLHEFPKAKEMLDIYVKIPDVANLPLFAQVMEYQPHSRLHSDKILLE